MAQVTKTGRTGSQGKRGFTLVELVIVMMIVMILAALAIPLYQASVQRAKEVTLRANLYHIRDAVDQYTADKKALPQTLDDLVTEGYFREIPYDPIMESSGNWRVTLGNSPLTSDPGQQGIVEVNSGSIDTASDGTQFSSW